MKQDIQENKFLTGTIVLFGSGETNPGLMKVYKYLLDRLPASPKIALLETPAGFELNSDQVIGRVGQYIKKHLPNFNPQIKIIPARRRGTYHSPNNPEILHPLMEADLIFMGPGSPTYAVRQLRDSLAWYLLIAHHYLGGAIVLASAATIAIGSCALPVYEIYKVGEDLHWKEGLDFFGLYGLHLVFVPHWNNNDGGDDLDTSRCFMGVSRFSQLLKMLPENSIVVGIDELTALIIEPEIEKCHVIGKGGVTLMHLGLLSAGITRPPYMSTIINDAVSLDNSTRISYYQSGTTFPLSQIGSFHLGEPEEILSRELWLQVLTAHKKHLEPETKQREEPPEKVIKMVKEREKARLQKDWVTADNLRDDIAYLGWEVIDTPDGPQLKRQDN